MSRPATEEEWDAFFLERNCWCPYPASMIWKVAGAYYTGDDLPPYRPATY